MRASMSYCFGDLDCVVFYEFSPVFAATYDAPTEGGIEIVGVYLATPQGRIDILPALTDKQIDEIAEYAYDDAQAA